VHNYRHPLDTRRQADGEPNESFNRIVDRQSLPVSQTMGLCMLGGQSPEEWSGTICEDPIDAQRCPDFVPTQTHDEILAEFLTQVRDVAWLEESMPEVAALLWVLEEKPAFRLPWWKRLWFKMRRFKVEPVRSYDVSHLLDAHPVE
jgi:hypothetical protein